MALTFCVCIKHRLYLFTKLSRAKPSMMFYMSHFFFLQEREQKQKLLDPAPIPTSQRFSEKYIYQKKEVCLSFVINYIDCISNCQPAFLKLTVTFYIALNLQT